MNFVHHVIGMKQAFTLILCALDLAFVATAQTTTRVDTSAPALATLSSSRKIPNNLPYTFIR